MKTKDFSTKLSPATSRFYIICSPLSIIRVYPRTFVVLPIKKVKTAARPPSLTTVFGTVKVL